MAKAWVALAIVLLGASPALGQDAIVLLAEGEPYAHAWRSALAEHYGIEAELAPPPRGATLLQRDAAAQRIVAAGDADLAIWIERDELCALSADDEAARRSPIPDRDPSSLARATVLVMNGGSAPRIARVSDFDRDETEFVDPGIEPIRPGRTTSARTQADRGGPYGGILASVLLIANDSSTATGAGVRGVAGYHFAPYVYLGGYVDIAGLDGERAGPFLRSCGEITVSYPWSIVALHFSGHGCAAWGYVPGDLNREATMWTAGGAISLSIRVAHGVYIWSRGEVDAMMADSVDRAYFFPAALAGVTFE